VVFFEHQSTINENMPLRDLMYCGRVYEMIVPKKRIYTKSRITIPTPEFYVIYNGAEEFPEKAVYRLSEMYALPPGEEPALELVVQVYNINPGHNGEVLQRSETLRDYMAFITKTRENEANGMNREEAIDKAIRDCVKEGILAEYLEKYGSEVRRGCRGTAPCFLYLIHLLA